MLGVGDCIRTGVSCCLLPVLLPLSICLLCRWQVKVDWGVPFPKAWDSMGYTGAGGHAPPSSVQSSWVRKGRPRGPPQRQVSELSWPVISAESSGSHGSLSAAPTFVPMVTKQGPPGSIMHWRGLLAAW